MAKSVEVKLLGQKIALKCAGNPEIIDQVVKLVSERLERAEKRGRSSVPHHVALLALLDLAEEFVHTKERFDNQVGRLEEKSNELKRLIEAELS